MTTPKTRFVLIGGFLGAGKTTLIGQLAQQYVSQGKRVGIITNDQADNLVDTQNLRAQGFDVGEVAGACFCCSFGNLIETAERLGQDSIPDILIAEPVGSCTDLVATVVVPMQQLFGDRFELAPFGVLLKPSHGKRILSNSGDKRSGFSPQAEYIFRKQLEEADYLMIGRADQLDEAQIKELSDLLERQSDGRTIIAVSPKEGQGIEQVMDALESSLDSPRLLEIDYDTYADGEAELGWVNMTALMELPTASSLDDLAHQIVDDIHQAILADGEGQIAHLKASVLGGDAQSVANVVSNESPVDAGLLCQRTVDGEIQLVVNARVAMDPDRLERLCRQQVTRLGEQRKAKITQLTAHSLRPGRPTPTHRVTSV